MQRNRLDAGTIEFIRVLAAGTTLSFAAIARWAGCQPQTAAKWARLTGARG